MNNELQQVRQPLARNHAYDFLLMCFLLCNFHLFPSVCQCRWKQNRQEKRSCRILGLLLSLVLIERFNYSASVNNRECHIHAASIQQPPWNIKLSFSVFISNVLLHLHHLISSDLLLSHSLSERLLLRRGSASFWTSICAGIALFPRNLCTTCTQNPVLSFSLALVLFHLLEHCCFQSQDYCSQNTMYCNSHRLLVADLWGFQLDIVLLL